MAMVSLGGRSGAANVELGQSHISSLAAERAAKSMDSSDEQRVVT